ncbi:MAG: manganese catalase family protein [Clostridia bacterium]|nr:manganese catalase family protein [Clostridia bacterium]
MDLNKFIVKANDEYPQIENAIHCGKTVGILKDLMAGQDSELKAVLQYFYQSSISSSSDSEISQLLEEISIVEMSHLELLSLAIVDFGGEPRYENMHGQSFSTHLVNYSSKLRDILDANIKGEENAIKNYSSAISMVENRSLKKLLERIIQDEMLHLKVFKYLRDNVRFMSY